MRLVVVSNRLPVSVAQDGSVRRSVGGLATAMHSFLRATEGGKAIGLDSVLWVGWPGAGGERALEALRGMGLELVPLTEEEVQLYYEGFSNSTLWPLFHGFTEYTVYEERFWRAYVEVNRKFAEAVARVAEPGDLVWIHDYHLMLAPAAVRQLAPDVALGFFLHIPFPPAEVYQLMPPEWRTALLEGLLEADLVGFHTHEYVANFLRAASRFLGARAEGSWVVAGDRRARVGAFPIGIDFGEFHGAGERPEVRAEAERVGAMLGGRKVVFSIDRLDYTKGVIRRLYAWRRFLEENPRWRRRAVFVLVVVPSRTEVPQYREMRRQIEMEVGRINGELGDLDWVPVVYLFRFIPQETLLALYQLADVALITPLRDGMNLVAKEYVASRRDCRGVLILSETAGAARELTEALVVNPNDVGGVAAAIARALEMQEEEQCRRLRAMQRKLAAGDVVKWAVDFINAAASARAERLEVERTLETTLPLDQALPQLLAHFGRASRPLVILDYDGTLVPHRPYAYQAVPDRELLELLGALAERAEVAVVSGRPREFLEAWLGGLPIHLAAEHGAFLRPRGGQWAALASAGAWKAEARRLMEEYTYRVPGTYVEEKEVSLAWHFRNAEPEEGERAAGELAEALSTLLQGTGAAVARGAKVVEVRPAGVDKGTAARRLLESVGPDFVAAFGDDETDEDMFRALPPEAYTVKVGRARRTYARYLLPSYRRVRDVLALLLKSR